MSLMDNMKNEAEDVMQNPDMRAKVEQYAKDKGISLDEAKQQLMKQMNQNK